MASYRPLMTYAFDPSRGHSLGNFMTLRVPYEPVSPGPAGEYLEVIDYDSSNGVQYEPVDLDSAEVLLEGGLPPSESDPRFHQQMVYAVASETIRQFERGLGRKVKWGFRGAAKEYRRLRLFPHAMLEANAYYARDLNGIVFGYFPASSDDPGRALPEQTIFTCLSHDIIAHETTHAIIDGQRRRFMENTNVDVAAFHEAFADITALFQHFTYKEALCDTIQRTGGQLHLRQLAPTAALAPEGPTTINQLAGSNPMVELALQFGESMGMRAALRSAIGTVADPTLLDKTTEPHERGSVLVAAIFDAYFTSFQNATARLFQIARSSGAIVQGNDLHPALAEALAKEAAKLAGRFLTMCIRAIDYCPPVDIQFGEYLRALITSDYELFSDDVHDYRQSLIDAFRLRGIRPAGVKSLSEESLRWDEYEPSGPRPACGGLQFDLLHGQTPAMQKSNARVLYEFARQNQKALHLTDDPIAIESFHPVVRTGQGIPRVEIVTEVIQRRETSLGTGSKATFEFFGGATLVMSSDGGIRYVVHKSLDEPKREERQREHLQTQVSALADYQDREPAVPSKLNFALIHRGF